MMLVDNVLKGDFVGFKKAVQHAVDSKIDSHPRMSKSQKKISDYNKMSNLFKQISK